MHATDIVAYGCDGALYCADCIQIEPGDEENGHVWPVFADNEGWHDHCCDGCGEALDPDHVSPRGPRAADYLEAFVQGYLECALWSSTDESRDDGGDPLDDNYDTSDIHPDAIATMQADCASFIDGNADDLESIDAEQAGHDFWLTRNGHGAGFWDRGLGALGDRLSKACKPYGSAYLIVGNDGMVHHG